MGGVIQKEEQQDFSMAVIIDMIHNMCSGIMVTVVN